MQRSSSLPSGQQQHEVYPFPPWVMDIHTNNYSNLQYPHIASEKKRAQYSRLGHYPLPEQSRHQPQRHRYPPSDRRQYDRSHSAVRNTKSTLVEVCVARYRLTGKFSLYLWRPKRGGGLFSKGAYFWENAVVLSVVTKLSAKINERRSSSGWFVISLASFSIKYHCQSISKSSLMVTLVKAICLE